MCSACNLLTTHAAGAQTATTAADGVPVAADSAVHQDRTYATAGSTQVNSGAAYVLGGGDQVVLHVADVDEVSDKPLHIDPDGSIDLPLIGHVRAAGLTLAQLRAELTQRFSKYVTNPQVAVNLVDNQSQTVSVLGEVNAPGVRQLPGPRNLVEVISLAGGIKADAGSTVIVTRQTQRGPLPLPNARQDVSGRYVTASVSLDDLVAGKIPADNILIQPSDVVSIPKGEIVYVVGNVRRAGGFPLTSHASMSLLQAISLAEGLAPDAAANRARILRPTPGSDGKPKEISVDVKQIFAGKAPDVPLYANDILFIPNSAAKTGVRRATDAIVQIATGAAIYAR